MKTLGFAFKHAETLWKIVAVVLHLVSISIEACFIPRMSSRKYAFRESYLRSKKLQLVST